MSAGFASNRKPTKLADDELIDIFGLLSRLSLECQQLVCRRFSELIDRRLHSVRLRVVDVVKLTYTDTREHRQFINWEISYPKDLLRSGVDMDASLMRTTNIDVFNNIACKDFRIVRDGFYGGCIRTSTDFLGQAVEIARRIRSATWLFLDSIWFPHTEGLLEVIQAFTELRGVHIDSYACSRDVGFVPEPADDIGLSRLQTRLETHSLLRTCSDKGVRKLYDNSDHHTLATSDDQFKTEGEILDFCFGGHDQANNQRRELRLKATSVSAQFPRRFIERYQRSGGSARAELNLSAQPEINFDEMETTKSDDLERWTMTVGHHKCILESRRLRLQEPRRGTHFFSIATLP